MKLRYAILMFPAIVAGAVALAWGFSNYPVVLFTMLGLVLWVAMTYVYWKL